MGIIQKDELENIQNSMAAKEESWIKVGMAYLRYSCWGG